MGPLWNVHQYDVSSAGIVVVTETVKFAKAVTSISGAAVWIKFVLLVPRVVGPW